MQKVQFTQIGQIAPPWHYRVRGIFTLVFYDKHPDALPAHLSAKLNLGGLSQMSELELFEILRKNLLPDLKKSATQFSRFDCESSAAKLHIELKCRRTHYDDLLIEKKKFDALVERADQIGFAPCYINATPQGIYAFNLRKVQVTWENHPMPATTDFGNAQLVEKAVGFLPIAQAVHLPGAVDL